MEVPINTIFFRLSTQFPANFCSPFASVLENRCFETLHFFPFTQGMLLLYMTKFPTLNVKSAKQIKFNEEIQSRKLENDCQNLKRNVQNLLAELNETKHLSQEMQAGLNKDMLDLKNVLSEKTNLLVSETETHKNELLDEIRQMNEELMKRSSKLSAQEQEIESIKENGQNKLQLAENQIQSLKEQLLNSSMNTSMSMSFTEKSEAMSTSTVSKVEETARMADVESSFEDR